MKAIIFNSQKNAEKEIDESVTRIENFIINKNINIIKVDDFVENCLLFWYTVEN